MMQIEVCFVILRLIKVPWANSSEKTTWFHWRRYNGNIEIYEYMVLEIKISAVRYPFDWFRDTKVFVVSFL